jgi:hypothetical protein
MESIIDLFDLDNYVIYHKISGLSFNEKKLTKKKFRRTKKVTLPKNQTMWIREEMTRNPEFISLIFFRGDYKEAQNFSIITGYKQTAKNIATAYSLWKYSKFVNNENDMIRDIFNYLKSRSAIFLSIQNKKSNNYFGKLPEELKTIISESVYFTLSK